VSTETTFRLGPSLDLAAVLIVLHLTFRIATSFPVFVLRRSGALLIAFVAEAPAIVAARLSRTLPR
jgi:hypothetical protein